MKWTVEWWEEVGRAGKIPNGVKCYLETTAAAHNVHMYDERQTNERYRNDDSANDQKLYEIYTHK